MSILLCVLTAWVTFGLLLVGLGLLIVERFSNASQVTIDDEASQGPSACRSAKLDHAMDDLFRNRVSSPILVTRFPNWRTRLSSRHTVMQSRRPTGRCADQDPAHGHRE